MHPEMLLAPPPPPPRSRRGLWISLIAAGVVLFLAVGVGAAFIVWRALEKPGIPSASLTASPAPSPAKRPQPGDPVSVYAAWALEKSGEALAKQREALLGGDEAGYLSVLDPAMSDEDRVGITRQFHSLRAMKVVAWKDKVTSPSDRGDGVWGINVIATACFVTAPCEDGFVQVNTAWRIDGDTATMVRWWPNVYESMPWQLSELVAVSGERTIVATTKEHQGKLDSLLEEAEKAAVVADRFGRKGVRPSRYVVYFAGTEEWVQWFTWSPPEWAGGGAFRISDDRYELILNADETQMQFVDYLMRHELTHAASLQGPYQPQESLWWLVEGIASFGELDGAPISGAQGMDAAGDLIDSGEVDSLEIEPPGSNEDPESVGGRYALALLGIQCVVDQFGEEKMIEFFHRRVHDKVSAADAADEVLGTSWSRVKTDCYDYMKDQT